MIFCSRNEKGESAWKLILEGRKTVTRRLKPVQVGKILAVQPNRGKTAVGFIKVVSCINEIEWLRLLKYSEDFNPGPSREFSLQCEAQLEGFESWDGLIAWFSNHKPLIRLDDCFRIQFELVKI